MQEKYRIIDIWKLKLKELEYQKMLMSKDNKFTNEDLNDLDVIINYVKNEYAMALLAEKKEDTNGKMF